VRGTTQCRKGLEVQPPFRRCEALPNVVKVSKCRHHSGDARHSPLLYRSESAATHQAVLGTTGCSRDHYVPPPFRRCEA